MKTLLRLTLAALILAGLTVPTFAETFTSIKWQPGTEVDCTHFCSIALCPETKPNCGALPGGGCGCYSTYSIGID